MVFEVDLGDFNGIEDSGYWILEFRPTLDVRPAKQIKFADVPNGLAALGKAICVEKLIQIFPDDSLTKKMGVS